MLNAVPPPVVSWSPPRTVMLGSQYVLGGPVAALNRNGDGVLVWTTTPKKPVFSAAGVVSAGVGVFGSPTPPSQIAGGSVVAATGGVRSGFRRLVTVVRYRHAGPLSAYPVVTTSGVVFVVWSKANSPVTLITRLSAHGVSPPRQLLPRGADLYEITSGENGANRVLWSVFRRGHGETLYGAPLRAASGRLGQTRRLVSVGANAVMPTVAFNDRGAAILAWDYAVTSVNQDVSQPIDVVSCPPAGRCRPVVRLHLGPSVPYANGFFTAALTDSGTAVVADDTRTGPAIDSGVWASVSRNGGPFGPEQQISATGNGPALAAVGQDSVVLTYTPPRPAPAADWDAPAVETLTSGERGFGSVGHYPGKATGDVPALLGQDGSSAFVSYWQTFTNDQDVTRIAIGGAGGIGTVRTLTTFSLPTVALDGRGDALVGWAHGRTVTAAVARTGATH